MKPREASAAEASVDFLPVCVGVSDFVWRLRFV